MKNRGQVGSECNETLSFDSERWVAQCLVGGEWVGDAVLPVTNPATGEVIAKVPDFGEAEAKGAILAAKVAFPRWSGLLAKERGAFTHSFP